MVDRVSAKPPFGCKYCGIEHRGHGHRWTKGVGMHFFYRPSDAQILARMRARRLARWL